MKGRKIENQNLLMRARKGDMSAFREIVEANKKNIYYLSLNLTGNHNDANDISQEVFLKLYKSISKIRGDSKLSTWLYKVTVNTYLSSKRKKTAKLIQYENNEGFGRLRENQVIKETSPNNPERDLESMEIKNNIENALKKVTDRERTVFVLRFYKDLQLKEIANVLNITEGTVKSLLYRTIKKLQKELSFYKKQGCLEKTQ